ncbi:MAG: hypothetical protein ABFR47_07795 [Verrucomicrobiota bacterium]
MKKKTAIISGFIILFLTVAFLSDVRVGFEKVPIKTSSGITITTTDETGIKTTNFHDTASYNEYMRSELEKVEADLMAIQDDNPSDGNVKYSYTESGKKHTTNFANQAEFNAYLLEQVRKAKADLNLE